MALRSDAGLDADDIGDIEFLSTHPTHKNRAERLSELMPDVSSDLSLFPVMLYYWGRNKSGSHFLLQHGSKMGKTCFVEDLSKRFTSRSKSPFLTGPKNPGYGRCRKCQ